ncbi:MAG: hypothetical protein MJZ54_01325 [Bacteroidaceae bacterium]|nr:hypothetical protein [Bacteroidaceae bacterium]
MIQFDKIKLVAPLYTISDIRHNFFLTKTERNTTISEIYKSKSAHVYVELNYPAEEVVIEMTGKILGSHYPALISLDTIRECFVNINRLGICTLDCGSILANAQVLKVDVTLDVDCGEWKDFASDFVGQVRNHNHYLVRKIANNIIVETNVKKDKLRLTVYDKGKEMEYAANQRFLEELENKNDIMDYFKGKTRFEMNIVNKKKILSTLQVSSNRMLDVLQAETNPIRNFLDKILDAGDVAPEIETLSDYKNYLLLQSCDFDIKKVEFTLRRYCGYNYRYQLDKIRAMLPLSPAANFKSRLLQLVS